MESTELIKINRDKVKKPLALDFYRKGSAANNELIRNIELIRSSHDGHDVKLEFTAYKSPNVTKAVNDLTGGRCAYCGVKDLRNSVQTEHYRPKTMVEINSTKKIRPGYYWLSSDWVNLLPSCGYCNSKKTVFYIDIDLEENESPSQMVIGKQNKFPILDCDREGGLIPYQEAEDTALLFNPDFHDPNTIFRYEPKEVNGLSHLLIVPASKDKADVDYIVAMKSIEIYGLNHQEIARDRFVIASRLYLAVLDIRGAMSAGLKEIKREVNALVYFLHPKENSSFIGLCQRISRSLVFEVMSYLLKNGEIRNVGVPIVSFDNSLDLLYKYGNGFGKYGKDVSKLLSEMDIV